MCKLLLFETITSMQDKVACFIIRLLFEFAVDTVVVKPNQNDNKYSNGNADPLSWTTTINRAKGKFWEKILRLSKLDKSPLLIWSLCCPTSFVFPTNSSLQVPSKSQIYFFHWSELRIRQCGQKTKISWAKNLLLKCSIANVQAKSSWILKQNKD